MPRCNYLQQSLAWCQGKPLYAGIRRRLYFIPRSDIVAWPELQRDEDSGVAVASYAFDSSFGLRADAVWHFIDILPEKSSLTSEPQGEFPNQTQLNKLVALHPGIGEEAAFAAGRRRQYPWTTDRASLLRQERPSPWKRRICARHQDTRAFSW